MPKTNCRTVNGLKAYVKDFVQARALARFWVANTEQVVRRLLVFHLIVEMLHVEFAFKLRVWHWVIVLDAGMFLVVLDEHESVAWIFKVLLYKLVLDKWAAKEDHVKRNLCRGTIVEFILVRFISEVGLCHHHLQVATVKQAIVDLVTNDFIEIALLTIFEELLVWIVGLFVLKLLAFFFVAIHVTSARHCCHSSFWTTFPATAASTTEGIPKSSPAHLLFFVISVDRVALFVELC